jgi:hypothetical protein
MRSATVTVLPQDAGILAALPLRPGRQLYIAPPDENGRLVVMEEAEDPEDDMIVGLAICVDGTWYLGCTGCCREIREADAGMCMTCRQDAEEQRVLGMYE